MHPPELPGTIWTPSRLPRAYYVPSRCGAAIRSSRFVIGRFCSNYSPVRGNFSGVSSATIFNANCNAVPSLSSTPCHHVCASVCVSLVRFFALDLSPTSHFFNASGLYVHSSLPSLWTLCRLNEAWICISSLRWLFLASYIPFLYVALPLWPSVLGTASMKPRCVFLVSCLPSLHRLGLGFVSYASTVYCLLSLLYPYKSMQYM
ncbi:hypothetical protein BDN67DRAFT_826718 [Paxillus ammoniavirescens]|nr:hypothetical protein BDN67DRAFT_826718 [Paxillus ammoniavirescens]